MGKGQKDKVKREFSAGGVVFKKAGNKILWLVAKSSPNKEHPGEYWRLPKGWLDDADGRIYPGPFARGERKATEGQLQESALREVREEGGVETKIVSKIKTVNYFTKTIQGPVLKFVTFYLMEWIKDLLEGYDHETDEILWLPLEDAEQKLSREREREILRKASSLL